MQQPTMGNASYLRHVSQNEMIHVIAWPLHNSGRHTSGYIGGRIPHDYGGWSDLKQRWDSVCLYSIRSPRPKHPRGIHRIHRLAQNNGRGNIKLYTRILWQCWVGYSWTSRAVLWWLCEYVKSEKRRSSTDFATCSQCYIHTLLFPHAY